MKEVIKHIRIAIAEIFLTIGHKINDEDIYDVEAKIRRLDPEWGKTNKTQSNQNQP